MPSALLYPDFPNKRRKTKGQYSEKCGGGHSLAGAESRHLPPDAVSSRNQFGGTMYNAALPAMLLSKASETAMGTVNAVVGITTLLGSILASVRKPPKSRVKAIWHSLLLSMCTENCFWMPRKKSPRPPEKPFTLYNGKKLLTNAEGPHRTYEQPIYILQCAWKLREKTHFLLERYQNI